jgi:hypothetical protein
MRKLISNNMEPLVIRVQSGWQWTFWKTFSRTVSSVGMGMFSGLHDRQTWALVITFMGISQVEGFWDPPSNNTGLKSADTSRSSCNNTGATKTCQREFPYETQIMYTKWWSPPSWSDIQKVKFFLLVH